MKYKILFECFVKPKLGRSCKYFSVSSVWNVFEFRLADTIDKLHLRRTYNTTLEIIF